MDIIKRIEEEIDQYQNGSVETSEGVNFSQRNLVRRILLFENKTYPTGKTDKQGRYKYWFDIISPRRDNEVKNIQVDTKHFLLFSDNPDKDFTAVYIANARLKEFLWDSGRAEELNSVAEEFSGRGNQIFKRVKGGYEKCDIANTYIVNQTAEFISETPVIERHQLTQSELREKAGVWNNIDDVIEYCGGRTFSAGEDTTDTSTTSPYYEIYERNGEVSEEELFEAQGKEGGDPNRFVKAKIIVAGLKKGEEDSKYVLFADKLIDTPENPAFVSVHRGPYKGRFWREGMYELLFDHQVRANEIGNQIARGLEWASKTIFRASEKLIAQNILTDLNNGDVIQSADLAQVQTRMEGFDQLIADWNRVLQDADRLANSYEVATGEQLPSGTPFALANLQNTNVNKLFTFLRQKLTLGYVKIFENWLKRELISDLKGRDIIRLTGDAEFMANFRKLQAENWYVRNLVAIGPHTPEIRDTLIAEKIAQLERTEPVIDNSAKETWDGVLPRIHLTITGENIELEESLTTISSLLQYEQDPVRRAFLLDRIYAIKGIPKPPAPQPQPQLTAAPSNTPSPQSAPMTPNMPLNPVMPKRP